MKKSTVIKFVIALIIVMIIFWITLNYLKNRNSEVSNQLEYNYFVLFQNEKMGVIDRNGNSIIEPKYDNIIIPNPDKDVFLCVNEEKKEYLNKDGNKLFELFEEVNIIGINGMVLEVPYEKKVLMFKQNNKFGLIDYFGNIVVQAEYDEIEGLKYRPEEFRVKMQNKYGVIDTEGKEIVKTEYDYIEGDKYYKEEGDSSGYIVGLKSEDGYKYGYLNESGKQILDIKYNKIERILDIKSEDVYLIAYENGKGAVIRNKKELTGYEYAKIEKVESEDLFWVNKAEKYGIIDLNGKIILNTEYEEVFVEGINIFAKKDGESYIFDLKGNRLEKIDYSRKYRTENENYYITVDNNNLYGVADKDNNTLINNNYVYLEYTFGDYFIVSDKDGKTGVIDKSNNQVIEIKYDIVEKLSEGNIIQVVELESSTLYLYNNEIKKVYEGINTQININENYIALINKDEIKYFDLNGNEINNIKEVEEYTMPERIGDYSKVYYSYGQIYYTDLQSVSE